MPCKAGPFIAPVSMAWSVSVIIILFFVKCRVIRGCLLVEEFQYRDDLGKGCGKLTVPLSPDLCQRLLFQTISHPSQPPFTCEHTWIHQWPTGLFLRPIFHKSSIVQRNCPVACTVSLAAATKSQSIMDHLSSDCDCDFNEQIFIWMGQTWLLSYVD